MSYNKKAHLRANIDAICTVLALEKEQRAATDDERLIMQGYSGFGGLKCVLNPANSLSDIGSWAKSELDLFPMVVELHQVIRDNTASEKEYKQYFASIKNSVLTAFYTPPEVVQTIANAIQDSGVTINRFLDPSAGMGEFPKAFDSDSVEKISFEKDILTGKILSHLHPDDKVKIEGFETIENRYNNYFDMVSSNIPFGEISVFDTNFMKQDKLHRESTRTIHNYFFVKGVDSLREGGLMAFITSQGVMNSPSNEPVRKWLMDNTNLVSAIRLPNNLFTDYAGTEVGSDLIVLQKNSAKEKPNFWEELFVSSSLNRETETYSNDYFYNLGRIAQTRNSIGTDPYGKSAQVYIHEGGTEGIADDMRKMLNSDLKANLNIDLYNQHLITDSQSKQQQTAPKINSPKVDIKEKISYQTLEVNVSEPVLSLYDLFNFTQEERTQIKPTRKRNTSTPNRKPVQLSMFSTENKTASQNQTVRITQPPKPSLDPRPFSGELKEYHKVGSLVENEGQVGYLKERYRDDAVFQPLDVAFDQKAKISRYIEIRDFYHMLYNHEAEHLTEHASLRGNLNVAYDNFVKRYGHLNDKSNLDIIKMDAGGKEILSLERFTPSPLGEGRGEVIKADIFHQPVAFNPNEITIANSSDEALIASLNKYGEVHLDYMESLMDGKAREEIIGELHGRIFFNPLVQNYEVSDRFIAGNVVEKAEAIERYLQNHPDDIRAQESLKALQEATPQPIRFEELDFNFGERWIGTSVYEDYIGKLFEMDVNISYYASRDDFMIKADRSNMIINEKFAVQGEGRLYTGIHLLKHALLNTTPNITKTIKVTDPDTGEDRDVKVPDGQAIQMANTKIDEIRNGFSDWLLEQSPEFKQKLADIYNRKFNCFVRPQYDGSHQSFPGLDLKALGIPDLYQSQKDCVWMLKQNGGGIGDHEVLRP